MVHSSIDCVRRDLRTRPRTPLIPHFRAFFAMMKSPRNTASRISEFKKCPPVSARPDTIGLMVTLRGLSRLQDRALLRRYSMVRHAEKVQNKSDEPELRGDEPTISTESVCEKSSLGNASEQPASGTDYSTSPISIAVTEAYVKEGLQGRTRKRRRYTGKAMKSSSQEPVSFIKSETVDLAELLVLEGSCKILESHSRGCRSLGAFHSSGRC